ncbi:transferrin-binding protein-like solute binding protein [Rodentibacter haemolyticus]|uniref:Transferrin-binding protein-like solute binding protein n=1 Tax=Rodentibacter haemolyticus TaxID=2778911 RepID=A0ABX6UZZ9_9PAST|nr:transferrin-binding protein-like solute binding protein [Rodentibacter haemolyticus]QPB41631.1 transferrin-binding protein-like solute binding protein [Rodentibacter haemolyticus]
MNNLIKFSLTLVAAGILAACSSSGGSSNAEAEKAAQQQAEAAKKAEAEKAAAEKAAAEAQAKKDNAVVNRGGKFVNKNGSDLILDNDAKGEHLDRLSNTAEMTVPFETYSDGSASASARLDTVVVGTPNPNQKSSKLGYVEDFDFVGNTANNGETTLSTIYLVNENDTTDASKTTVGGTARAKTETKTATAGTEAGKAFVYDNQDRVDYTNHGTTGGRSDVVLKDSVAEVYGHRTFAQDYTTNTENGTKYGNKANQSNLPLVTAKTDRLGNTYFEAHQVSTKDGVTTVRNALGHENTGTADSYTGATLQRVQYGRVTSSLNDSAYLENQRLYKDGVAPNSFVVNYGEYGDRGTENNYFYRGVQPTTKEELAKLSGTLTYQGHAVAFGLHNPATDGVTGPVTTTTDGADNPANAISAKPSVTTTTPAPENWALKSGHHVQATVDLATKAVSGSVYDVYQKANNVDRVQTLATFKGDVAAQGNIAGTSAKAYGDKSTGSFQANLFGPQAQELGGSIVSDAKDANKWGAVFGAVKTGGPATLDNPFAASTDKNKTSN